MQQVLGSACFSVQIAISGRLPGALSARLGAAEWLDGAFSAGDLMMVSVLLRLKPSRIVDEYPNLPAYVARGEARPAYQRAFAAQLALLLAAEQLSCALGQYELP